MRRKKGSNRKRSAKYPEGEVIGEENGVKEKGA